MLVGLLAFGIPEKADAPASQAAQYNAEIPKTIVELQQFRQTSSIRARFSGRIEGTATLVNLNPSVNAWYLLTLTWNDPARGGAQETDWHLENPKPQEVRILLDEKNSSGVVITEGNKRSSCDLFGALEQGRSSRQIYYPLCQGRLYLRNPAKGARTALESATEFLRNQVWGGEKVIDIFHHILEDRYRETGELQSGKQSPEGTTAAGGPLPARIDPRTADRLVAPIGLGISLESQYAEKHGMTPGAWYPAAGNPGVYISVLQPNLIDPAILHSYPRLAANLDSVEQSSLCYLIAFDADRFDFGYSLGTAFPEVNWSNRIPLKMRDPNLPGPDGIGTIAPLISTGLISPEDGRRTVASFTGGFKREHGAFRYGELATRNHGSHYGFIQNGVVFSKLQPGLATVFVMDDGSVHMKTWQESDNSLLARIRHARQNGAPLVEFDDTAQATIPGRFVTQWGPGNWSGSENEKLRTIRAGLGMQTNQGKRFVVYAVFSDATPSAMARVFQAYRLDYGMLSDMNALEHTYLAVYRKSGNAVAVEHLLSGMSVLDKAVAGQVIPRFLGYPDNRDFFYVMRRSAN
jgi:hypothetical protein